MKTLNENAMELIKKKSHLQLVFETVISQKLFGYYSFMIVLCLEIHGVFSRLFPLFDSVTSAVTTYNVGFFKPNSHDLSNFIADEVRNLSKMFLALQKFASKEDKLKLKCQD